ncbi:MAG: alfa-L-rhamnosidase RamA [Ruminococcaceae bacterium]|nr:alfa-L-rhamnosidase RamA [Oscillospiraceae bacterium]
MRIEKLKTNHVTNPLGFAMDAPVFSYVVAESTGKRQQAARIRVARDAAMQDLVYDSGLREDISSLAFRPELTLLPRTRYYWEVEAVADDGDRGVSEPAWFETGKQDEAWAGQWICAPFSEHPVFTKSFRTTKPVASARLYLCGLGLYEAYLGGEKVGEEFLAPFFTSYQHHVQYQTYDVTALLSEQSELSVMLGRGWYHGRFCFGDFSEKIYGDTMQLIAELRVLYEDGTEDVIATDESWQCTHAPILESSIYDGETYAPGTLPGEPVPAIPAAAPAGALRARLSLPVIRQEAFPEYRLLHTPAGELVLDFGQEITGWVEFDADLPAGREIHFDYGELLQNDCFYNGNLRTALAAYTYISDGKARHVRPFFTFYGFRYVRITGMTEEEICAAKFTAYAVYSALDSTASIETSHDKVNRLIQNAVWSQKGNFLDVPTDCPQRDERMGWTGDAEVFASTAAYNMDTAAFYRKYLYDMSLEQQDLSGSIPYVVPDVLIARHRAAGKRVEDIVSDPALGHGSCAWGDAATIIPWTVYQYYGDPTLLEEAFPMMCGWVDYIGRQIQENCGGGYLWSCGFHFGDWLALDNPGSTEDDRLGGTDNVYVATAYYYRSADLTARAARVLGHEAEAAHYAELAEKIREAFRAEYYTATGRLAMPTQTAHAIALQFGLAPEEYRERMVRDLKARLDARHIHLDTGFVGTSMLCDVLSRHGLSEYAHTLLLNEDFPSWLYEVNMGATTIWERWDSVLPDGSISDTGMNSMNHYSYGAVLGWMYRSMAGLNFAEDGYGWKRAELRPETDARFDYVTAHYDSAAGRWESSWQREGDRMIYRVTVPFDAEAGFRLPAGQCLATVNGAPAEGTELSLTAGQYEIIAIRQ